MYLPLNSDLEQDTNEILKTGGCTCDFYLLTGQPCKHIWAVLLYHQPTEAKSVQRVSLYTDYPNLSRITFQIAKSSSKP